MFLEFSSNVILAKARAMYGKRIKPKDFDNLLNCKSVFEIASFLKNNTSYSKILSNVNESEVHRGELEYVIKNKIFDDLASLGRYEIASGDDFSDYLIAKAEVEQIIHSLMYLFSLNQGKAPRKMPVFFIKHTKINLSALANIKSYSDFLIALRNSPYKKLLKDVKPLENGQFNLSQIEYILYNYLYGILFKSIENTSKKSAKDKLMELYLTCVNYGNFVRIVRNKNNKSTSSKFIILENGSISQKNINAMLQANSEHEIFDIMKSLHQGYLLKKIDYNYIDQIPLAALYKKCKHEIHSSVESSVVLLSYMFLMENELNNIIKIIEGIRYNLSKDDILNFLIL